MKAVKARVTRALNVGSRLVCADNTGAKVVEIISVGGYHGVKRRQPAAGVASLIKVAVKEGDMKTRHQMFNAVIIRQKQEYRRKDGTRVMFEDNAAVITDDYGEPKGTEIKGPVAKEVVERYSSIGKISTIVV